jgi:site-specific DNA recombinase
MTRAAIYRRVSTQAQAQDNHFSLGEQYDRCGKYCEARNYEIVADFEERHSGAYLEERPRLTELRDMVCKGLIDVVVVTNFDRLSRDQIHQAVILHEMDRHSVRLELTEESFENDANGRFIRSLAGYFAEVERDKIKSRTARGRLQRVQQGLMIPGGYPLYGYSWADTRKSAYVINPRTAPVVQRIWQEAASGKPIRRIALDLTKDGIDAPRDALRREKSDPNDPPRGDPWRFVSVRNILHHPAYWGAHSAYRWDTSINRTVEDPVTKHVRRVNMWKERTMGDVRTPLPNAAPALVDLDTVVVVHEHLAFNKEAALRNNKHGEDHLLRAGFIKCGMCGKNMNAKRHSNGKPIYRCPQAVRDTTRTGTLCGGPTNLVATGLDAEVWESVMTVLTHPECIEQYLLPHVGRDRRQDAIVAIAERIKELDGEASNLTRAIRTMGDKPGSERLLEALEMAAIEKQKAERELKRMQQEVAIQQASLERIKDVQTMIYSVMRAGERFDYTKKRAILYLLNVRVTAYPRGHDKDSRRTSYKVTVGRHNEVQLPLQHPLYSDPKFTTLR